jgi:hypothetical protein
MSEQSPFDFNILSGLRNAIGKECPECGEISPSTATNCEHCGCYMPADEDDEPSLSFMHAEGVSGHDVSDPGSGVLFKHLHEIEKNMDILNETIDLAKEAAISYSEYYDNILKVFNIASSALDHAKSESVKNYISMLDEDEQRLANQAVSAYEVYYQGCKRMLEYDGGGDGVAVVDGFLKVKKSIKTLNEVSSKMEEAGIGYVQQEEEIDEDTDENETGEHVG